MVYHYLGLVSLKCMAEFTNVLGECIQVPSYTFIAHNTENELDVCIYKTSVNML